MPSNILMPKTGADATEAKIVRWLKKEGDRVSRGDVVAEIETEKVNMEVESFGEGTLFRVLAPEGATMEVGKPIAILLKEGEQPPADAAAPTTAPAVAAATPEVSIADRPLVETPGPAPATAPVRPEPASAPAPQFVPALAATSSTAGVTNGYDVLDLGGRIKASPLARRLAQEHNLDLRRIQGRGPGGRIVREDIEVAIQQAAPYAPAPMPLAPSPVAPLAPAAPAAAPEPAPVAATAAPEAVPAGAMVRPLSRVRLTTARRLAESKQTAPHFYITVDVDMAEALKLRATLNEQAGGELKISVNDLVLKASAWALQRHPDLNSSFRDGSLVIHDHINISVAVALEDGLVSPVIPDVDRKSLGQIARESKAMVERARNGKLRAEDYEQGTFTVSNLGMFDVDTFIAIINPPQAAILAVGSVQQVPVVRDGQITIGEIMKATLSADHRATDGAQAARFLADVRRALEKPLLMAL
jgi:pyruvate dehydrogenase E2 component (dihydrolipoamide acetyltransferase)